MAIEEIKVLPEQGSYSVGFAKNTISTKLDGGRSRFRLTKKKGVSFIDVNYNLNQEDYQYFWAFFNNSTNKGASPFRSYLYMYSADLTLHLCRFVPGSVKLLSQRGNSFVVGARLEVSEDA